MGESNAAEEPQPWLAIVGPTCSGKTWFAGELIRRFPLELVNLDSFQVFSQFQIGTGRADMTVGPAHLYGFADPREPLSPRRYGELVREVVEEIALRGRRPLFEGGSISFLRELLRIHPLRLLGIRPITDEASEALIMNRLSSYPFEALVREIRHALESGYRDTIVLSDNVVYLPVVQYLEGQADLDETIDRMRRNLVERQRTQMREYEPFDIQWFDASRESLPALIRVVEEVLDG